jgi:hypothetical protein
MNAIQSTYNKTTVWDRSHNKNKNNNNNNKNDILATEYGSDSAEYNAARAAVREAEYPIEGESYITAMKVVINHNRIMRAEEEQSLRSAAETRPAKQKSKTEEAEYVNAVVALMSILASKERESQSHSQCERFGGASSDGKLQLHKKMLVEAVEGVRKIVNQGIGVDESSSAAAINGQLDEIVGEIRRVFKG